MAQADAKAKTLESTLDDELAAVEKATAAWQDFRAEVGTKFVVAMGGVITTIQEGHDAEQDLIASTLLTADTLKEFNAVIVTGSDDVGWTQRRFDEAQAVAELAVATASASDEASAFDQVMVNAGIAASELGDAEAELVATTDELAAANLRAFDSMERAAGGASKLFDSSVAQGDAWNTQIDGANSLDAALSQLGLSQTELTALHIEGQIASGAATEADLARFENQTELAQAVADGNVSMADATLIQAELANSTTGTTESFEALHSALQFIGTEGAPAILTLADGTRVAAGVIQTELQTKVVRSLTDVIGRINTTTEAMATLRDTIKGMAQFSISGSIRVAISGVGGSFAGGGGFVTNGPELILVGDNPTGREHVNISPIGPPGVSRIAPGSSISSFAGGTVGAGIVINNVNIAVSPIIDLSDPQAADNFASEIAPALMKEIESITV